MIPGEVEKTIGPVFKNPLLSLLLETWSSVESVLNHRSSTNDSKLIVANIDSVLPVCQARAPSFPGTGSLNLHQLP